MNNDEYINPALFWTTNHPFFHGQSEVKSQNGFRYTYYIYKRVMETKAFRYRPTDLPLLPTSLRRHRNQTRSGAFAPISLCVQPLAGDMEENNRNGESFVCLAKECGNTRGSYGRYSF